MAATLESKLEKAMTEKHENALAVAFVLLFFCFLSLFMLSLRIGELHTRVEALESRKH